ncbi:NAD-dependent epimerase/dehydratase family protein [Panacibacter ginsenosidivorans]|uniref:NAD-dependent epimerase/dehydratase family protein n=1 Tax=Panacibacter ginsenosidivorans TaxID=1813871 RepID=A0A5B8V362_9BACT|nr:NAD-dependent epimerase/dehydratase family protein [Panacibacter ginsenosidivorans]QEC65957.1 NAD-dependent epimerase/dehydratase family protein [Panacibacter ginsenosidivorans]
MKKILVTGSTGFIGNYVVQELLKNNYQVIASSAREEKAKQFSWYSQVKYVAFNFQDFDESINYALFFDSPDAVIHLAWEGLPNYKSLFHFETNLPLHYKFLKNLIVNGIKDITVTGTCFEYGMQDGSLSEDMQSMPANPYALAKDSLRKFLQELQKVEPYMLKWIRLFYMYGSGQNPNSLLSQLDKALANGDKVFNMSGGEQTRDYLPVEKVATYVVQIATQNNVTGIVNCCSGKPSTVKSLVEKYLEEKNKNISLNLGHYQYPDYEPMHFWGDDKKLKTIINNG